jgi:hypothetical protein
MPDLLHADEHIDGFEFQILSTQGLNSGGRAMYEIVGNASIETTVVKHGAASCKLGTGASVVSRIGKAIAAGNRVLTTSIYFRYEGSLPGGDRTFASTGGPSNGPGISFIASTGRLRLTLGTTTADFGPVLQADTWYLLDWTMDVSGTTFTCSAMIDGTDEGTLSRASQTAADITNMRMGSSGANTDIRYLDDWVISTDAADYPLGEHEVKLLLPTGDGTHNAGTNVIENQDGTDIGVVTAFDLVNEIPPESTDYVRQAAVGTGNYAEVTFDDPADIAIWGVSAWVTLGTTSSNSGLIARVVDSGGNTLVDHGGATSTVSLPAQYSQKVVPDPGDDGWTNAELAGLRGRIGFSNDVIPIPRGLTFALQYATAPAEDVLIDSVSGELQLVAPPPGVQASSNVLIDAVSGELQFVAPAPEVQTAPDIFIDAVSGELQLLGGVPAVLAPTPVLIDAPAGFLIIEGSPPIAPLRSFPGPTRIRRLPAIGSVIHEFVSRDGRAVRTRLGDWEAEEEAPGGYGPASGVISEALFNRHPEVFRFGTDWRTYHESDGECVWGGTLLEPLVSGSVLLAGRGRGSKAERDGEDLLYQTYDLDVWNVASFSENINWEANVGRTVGLLDGEDDSSQLGIHFRRLETDGEEGPGYAAVSAAFHGHDLRRLAFNFSTGDNAANFSTTRVLVLEDPHLGGSFSSLPTASSLVWLRTIGNDVDLEMDWVTEGPTFERVVIDLHGPSPGEPHGKIQALIIAGGDLNLHSEPDPVNIFSGLAGIHVSRVRVNEIAPGDFYSASDLVRDIAGRLGVPAVDVDLSSVNVLPYWLKDGAPYAEALDHAAVLAGWRWLVLDTGTRAYLDFGPYSKRRWRVDDRTADMSPEPGEIFNVVRVPALFNDNVTEHHVTVRANPDPLPDARNVYGRLDVVRAFHNEDYAREFGERVLSQVSKRRWGGTGELVEVMDSNGQRTSAHRIHAGDTIDGRIPQTDELASLRVGHLRRSAERVSVTFDPQIRALDRLLARRERRAARV